MQLIGIPQLFSTVTRSAIPMWRDVSPIVEDAAIKFSQRYGVPLVDQIRNQPPQDVYQSRQGN